MTQRIEGGDTYIFFYDAVGNRLQENRLVDTQAPEVANTYAYDDANRLTGVNGVSYTWMPTVICSRMGRASTATIMPTGWWG